MFGGVTPQISSVATGSDLEEFIDSMPPAYSSVFHAEDIRQHAALVLSRGDRTVHVTLWSELPDGMVVLVVVADDRPGLLSTVSAGLVAHRLDVQAAQVYSRQKLDGSHEAVDLFWVLPTDEFGRIRPLRRGELERLSALIADGLIEGDGPASGAEGHAPLPEPVAVRVFFDIRALRRGEKVLVVETKDTPGLLFAITSALHRERIEIVSSDIRTSGDLVHDRFLIRADGEWDDARLARVRQVVSHAVQATHVERPL